MSPSTTNVISLTFKKSKKRSTWQMKRGNHEVVSLHWMTDIIEYCMPAAGYDPADRHVIYKLGFAAQPFAGYQVALRQDDPAKSRFYGKAKSLYGTYYQVSEVMGTAALPDHTGTAAAPRGPSGSVGSANGFVPEAITGRFPTPPEHLYFKIEVATAAIFVD